MFFAPVVFSLTDASFDDGHFCYKLVVNYFYAVSYMWADAMRNGHEFDYRSRYLPTIPYFITYFIRLDIGKSIKNLPLRAFKVSAES